MNSKFSKSLLTWSSVFYLYLNKRRLGNQMKNIFSSASEIHIKKPFKFFGNEGQFFT